MKVEDTIGFAASRAAQALRLGLERRLSESGLDTTPEQWAVLSAALRFPGSSQQRIAEEVCKDKGTIAHIVLGLERRRLVRRVRDTEDRRNYRVYVTPKGKSLQNKANAFAAELLEKSLEGLSQREIQAARTVLLKMFEALKRDE